MQPRTFITPSISTDARQAPPASFTFATLPTATQMTAEMTGVQAYTTDQGMCYWNGASWVAGGVTEYQQTASEIAAQLSTLNPSQPQSINYPPDGIDILNVFRFFSAAQIADVLAGTLTQDVSAQIQQANDFLEGRLNGIGTLGNLVGGTSYTAGTYSIVHLTGGSGVNATANITVSGGAVTSVTIVSIGNKFAVGDVLSAAASSIGGTGSGFSIKVTSILNTGGKHNNPGGKLFFPGGSYYCNMTGVRVGDMVEWTGNQFSASQLVWNNAFTGNCVTLGPDQSGFDDRSGYYVMGAVIDSLYIQMGTNSAWGIYTTGAQQNCRISNLWINGVNQSGGIFAQDHKGAANFRIENVYIIGGNAQSATCVGIHCDFQSCIEIQRVSMNGGGGAQTNPNFVRGVEIVSGGHNIIDLECELCTTGVDIAAGTGEFPQVISTMDVSGTVTQAIWIHSGFTGDIVASGINVGSGIIPIKNDNTGESKASGGSGAVVPFYTWSGTASDISMAQNLISIPPMLQPSYGTTVSIDVSTASSFIIKANNGTAFTISAPTVGANAMPPTGRTGQRILIKVGNFSGGSLGVITWNAVYAFTTTWLNPPNNVIRSVEFEWDGTNWNELWQQIADGEIIGPATVRAPTTAVTALTVNGVGTAPAFSLLGANSSTIGSIDTTNGSGGFVTFTRSGTSYGFIGNGANTITGALATDLCLAGGASGRVVIGTASGGAVGAVFGSTGTLTPIAGTTTVSPLTFQSGTNLTTAAAGACEFDGTCFYSSPATSSRAVTTTQYLTVLNGAYTLTSQTAAQKLFNATTNGAVTLPIGTYEFKCSFSLTSLNTGTSSIFGFALGGAATFTQAWWSSASGSTLATASALVGTFNTAANVAIVAANTTGVGYAVINGIIRVTVAGTVIPQVSLNTAAAAVVGINSYFRAWPVGNGTVTNVGNWS